MLQLIFVAGELVAHQFVGLYSKIFIITRISNRKYLYFLCKTLLIKRNKLVAGSKVFLGRSLWNLNYTKSNKNRISYNQKKKKNTQIHLQFSSTSFLILKTLQDSFIINMLQVRSFSNFSSIKNFLGFSFLFVKA